QKMTNNLNKLTKATKQLSQRNFEISLPKIDTKDEVGSMIKAFEVMQDSLNSYIKELDASKQRLNLALEGSSDGLWDWNLITNEVYFSPRYKEMLGYKDSELENSFESWKNLLYPEQLDRALTFLESFLASDDTNYEQKFKLKTKNGEYIPILARAKKVLNKDGKAIRLIGTHVDLSELTKVQEKLLYQAQHDALTNLPNRVLFLDRLQQGIKKARRYENKIAILFLDLDHFKEINDTLGHDAGDKLLIKISQILKKHIRLSDTVSRFGGDEFAIIVDEIKDDSIVIDIVKKIIDDVNMPHIIDGKEFINTFSIGIAIYPNDGNDAPTLLKNADLAMYKAKNSGRNAYTFYTEDMTQKALERIFIESNLRNAINNNLLEIYYQPQIDSQTNKIIGLEASVRWFHDGQYIPPSIFIPTAENIGLIAEIDIYVMKKVLNQIKEWKKSGINPPIIAMNLSVIDLKNNNYIDILREQLILTDCKTSDIEFEITETQLMNDSNESLKVLNIIKDLGVKISIDDFGTGYSSLSYIKKLPIDKIKIDKSFIDDITYDVDDQEIVKTVVSMARNMNLKVIAEGVESHEQVKMLSKLNCTEIQGYFYYKPMDKESVEKLLKQGI
ncbi:MAG: EAL domain-containing protein, partial [Campylobacterales bacterium]|nr:EAL domain-containing protein [Campylobacterales bacterium]